MKALYLLVALCLIPACSLLPQNTKDQAVNVAGKICVGLSAPERDIVRAQINAELAKKDMLWCGLKCPGEPVPTTCK